MSATYTLLVVRNDAKRECLAQIENEGKRLSTAAEKASTPSANQEATAAQIERCENIGLEPEFLVYCGLTLLVMFVISLLSDWYEQHSSPKE